MISLQSILCSPEPKDPQDAEVAKHYLSDRSGFEEMARYWAEIYAGAPATSKLSTSTGVGAGTSADGAAATGVDADEKKAKAGKKKAPVVDEVAAAGLNAAHVQ